MDEGLKKRIAVFRYGVIADFTGGRRLSRGETERLMREKCAQRWDIPGSTKSSISRSTVKEWIGRYKDSGGRLESLYPRVRSDKGRTRAIDDDVASGLIALRKELPEVSLPVLLSEARVRKIILPGEKVSYSTLYRFLQAEGLLDKPASAPSDRRRFEAEYPNDLWQSDVMHGPYVEAEDRKRKTYLIAFIDDMSRLVPHAEFYLWERLESFLDALRKALLMRGIPRKLYVDNGPSFRSNHLEHICASLGIVLLHARAYQPEGKGKIERWFKTVRGGFLCINKATTLEGLNDDFSRWLSVYNETRHSITGQPPIKRFAKNIECVRAAPKDLEDHFRKSARRTVAKDRTISLNNRLYEAPVELVGRQVTLLYHEDDPERVEVFFGGKTHGFVSLVDVNVNYRVKRQSGVIRIETDNAPDRYKGGFLFRKKDKKEDTEK
jgi:transposase InsO family protein